MWLSGGRASVLSDWSFIQCGLIGKRGETIIRGSGKREESLHGCDH